MNFKNRISRLIEAAEGFTLPVFETGRKWTPKGPGVHQDALSPDCTGEDRRLCEDIRGMDFSVCPELASKNWPE